MKPSRIIIIILAGAVMAAFFNLDIHHYFSLSSLKANIDHIHAWQSSHPFKAVFIYMAIYISITALSLPGATIMSLAGGAVFGLWKGVIIVSFASTIGATLAFIVSRFLFRDAIEARFAEKLAIINRGIEKEGGFYLFSLRLVPIFPFFIINMLMGLTKISTMTFTFVSQIGMLPATFVYINAGRHLSQLESLQGILSPGLLSAFALLGIFPIAAKKILEVIKRQRVMSAYKKPKKFDYNLIVIGGGSAGLVASYIAAAVKAKVALIERDKMGGDCLNTGCVPSKALIKSARVLSQVKRAENFGFKKGEINYNFADVMERVHRIIKKVEPHDSVERYTGLGVTCIKGDATITSPYEVTVQTSPCKVTVKTSPCKVTVKTLPCEVAVKTSPCEVNVKRTNPGEDESEPEKEERVTLTTRSIIVATGASPFVPDIPGLDQIDFYTSDTIWNIKKHPGKMLVLGGGPIGCELAQAFSSFGSQVTIVQRGSRLMKKEDPEVSQLVKEKFEAHGITVITGYIPKKFSFIKESHGSFPACHLESANDKNEKTIKFNTLLIALGRKPNVKGLGLEKLGINILSDGTIESGDFLETNIPNIFCAGDVAGPYQFTHTAAHQSWFASVNALFGGIRKFKVDYRTIPWATFIEPEVARVGLNESEARKKNIPFEITRFDLSDLDRAIADSENHGFVKILTVPGKDKIIGVTIVGSHAADIIAEFVLAMKHGLGLNKILSTIHIYPTMAEANKYAAGEWKKAHAPEKLLLWIEKFHAWMRNDF
ncbi:Mercuric reductase (Hg(II) reductase) [Desulfamplus magnetovallimortis]|uniref:Mercuric reductase (Hg(II) reductase) n=1 Tax=Desulfamplus magnetovallimortis TaxID=1246637 RepID=A0A1W1H851_9BACT|nr:bifunctional TVP38/TMEM64 family protein/FAD-dependent oxidoreductase [Desulfamplus magnetovallimortis]SLM28616.1 Mercuric reductase (Hg(II) reductase) [Desulfamplus magnetovallimortis]